jgi:hypothetical protein
MPHRTSGRRAAHFHLSLTMAIAAALLSACGGGGSSSSDGGKPIAGVGDVNAFLVDDFVTTLATKGGAFSGSRTDSAGNQYTLKVVYAPGAPGWMLRHETLVTNGVAAPTTTTSVNYSTVNATSFRVLGWMDDRLNTASKLQNKALPQEAKVGSGGNIFTADVLIQANGLNTADVGLTHTLSYDWTLSATSVPTPGYRAELCLNLSEAAPFVTQSKIDCFQINGVVLTPVYAFTSTAKLHAKGIDTAVVYQ